MRPPTPEEHRAALIEAASEPDKDQAMDQLALASYALATGDDELSEKALRAAVVRMQDFRADGQFAAIVGAESAKEWKGEPYEKMAAFLELGFVLLERGDHGNALAMSKSALLADTGTRAERFLADFVPAYVLQALAYQAAGEDRNAERSIERAVDAVVSRRVIDELTRLLEPIERKSAERPVLAAKDLLLAGLPAGVAAHPRDPVAAVSGALSYATDVRQVALESRRRNRPLELRGLSKTELRRAFDHLDRIAGKWTARAEALPPDLLADVEADAAGLEALLDEPSLVLVVAKGRGPVKTNAGRYGEVLQLVPRPKAPNPHATLDGVPLRLQHLDSMAWQATTRGGRAVDGFLAGKAVFKDASIGIGYGLMVAGDIAQATDSAEVAAVAYILGGITWIAGAASNPRADTRQWSDIPDDLWLVSADPPPGQHTLRLDGRDYTVDIPDRGTVVHFVPNLPPWGARTFGTPCVKCDVPLAIPSGETP